VTSTPEDIPKISFDDSLMRTAQMNDPETRSLIRCLQVAADLNVSVNDPSVVKAVAAELGPDVDSKLTCNRARRFSLIEGILHRINTDRSKGYMDYRVVIPNAQFHDVVAMDGTVHPMTFKKYILFQQHNSPVFGGHMGREKMLLAISA
jgi:hypothetical protein